ncbi:MAG TPA: hypothetical protein VIF40_14770 [Methylosinus sp.]
MRIRIGALVIFAECFDDLAGTFRAAFGVGFVSGVSEVVAGRHCVARSIDTHRDGGAAVVKRLHDRAGASLAAANIDGESRGPARV